MMSLEIVTSNSNTDLGIFGSFREMGKLQSSGDQLFSTISTHQDEFVSVRQLLDGRICFLIPAVSLL